MTFDDDDLLRKNPLLQRVLIRSEEIQLRVRQLGNEISRDYEGSVPVLVSILKGSYVFLADLTRCLSIPHEVDFMAISSYHGGTQSTGVVKIEKDLKTNITDRDVLIVEDIIDSGLTLSWLKENLEIRGAKSVRICTMLRKPEALKVEVDVAYVGFDIPVEFVVGYGLDYAENYRNLRDVAILAPHVYSGD